MILPTLTEALGFAVGVLLLRDLHREQSHRRELRRHAAKLDLAVEQHAPKPREILPPKPHHLYVVPEREAASHAASRERRETLT